MHKYSVTQYMKLDSWGSIDNKLCLVDGPLQMPAITMPSTDQRCPVLAH